MGRETLPDWTKESPLASTRGGAAEEEAGDETGTWSPEACGVEEGGRTDGEEDEGGSGDLPTHLGFRHFPLLQHLFLFLHLEQLLHLGTEQFTHSWQGDHIICKSIYQVKSRKNCFTDNLQQPLKNQTHVIYLLHS